MKSSDLLRAIGDVDEKYVKSAKKLIKPKKEQNKFVSGSLSALKFAGAAAVVLAVILAIWIPSRFFPHDPEPVQPGTATETNAPPTDTTDPVVDPAENNVFVCDGKAVRGVIGVCDNYVFDNDRGTYVTPETDTVGVYEESVIPKALLTSEAQPTLYYKKGDYIQFNHDEKQYYLKEMTLWYSDGVRTVASCNNTIFTLSDIVRDALDNHPGTYCLTAELIGFEEYGAEYKHVVYGVKLVSTVELPDRDGYNVFLHNGAEVEGKLYLTEKTRINPDTGIDYLEREGVDTKVFLKDTDVPVIYFEKGDSLDFRSYPDYYSRENYILYNANGESVAGGWTLTDIIKYLRNNPGEYRLTVEATMSLSALSQMFETWYEYYGLTVISCEEAGSDPDTDAGRVLALAQSLAENGYNEETWQKLLSYGDTAFDTLVKRYFEGQKDVALRTVISNYASYLFKAEAENQKNDAFTKAFGGQKYLDLQSDFSNLSESEWLYKYRASARTYGAAEEETVVAENTPNIYRLLGIVKFSDYPYYPERHGVPEMVEEYIKLTLEKDKTKKTETIANYVKSSYSDRLTERMKYCAERYQAEEDDNARALLCWIVYNILRYNSTVTDAAFREAHDYTDVNENNVTYKNVVEKLAPYIADYEKAAEEYAKTMLREYVEEDTPAAYAILSAYGFDGYKPGKPDISFYAREAIKAAAELFCAVRYGYPPAELYKEPEGNNYVYEIPLEDFYAYFEKYIERDIIDKAVRNSEALQLKNGIIVLFELGPQNSESVMYRESYLTGQSGDTAVISTPILLPMGMYSWEKEMTFEVKRYGDGYRVSGGTFADLMLSPALDAAYSVSYVLGTYLILREGQTEYDSITNNLISDLKMSIDDVREEYRSYLREGAVFPVSMLTRIDGEDKWLRKYASDEIFAALRKETDVFDGRYFVYPYYAKTKTTPDFDHGFRIRVDTDYYYECYMSLYDTLFAMNVIECSKDRVLLSLDFIREENGVKKNVTYTFEVRYGVNDPYAATLTGGTFVTELILDK